MIDRIVAAIGFAVKGWPLHPPYVGARLCLTCRRWSPSNDVTDHRMREDYYCRCDERDAA